MRVTRRSSYSGKEHTLDLAITEQQLFDYEMGKSGLIQNAFPHLTADEREFLMTGITGDEWRKLFPPEEEDGGY
jgi:hypothetical protein